jgi:hypothetical protein
MSPLERYLLAALFVSLSLLLMRGMSRLWGGPQRYAELMRSALDSPNEERRRRYDAALPNLNRVREESGYTVGRVRDKSPYDVPRESELGP